MTSEELSAHQPMSDERLQLSDGASQRRVARRFWLHTAGLAVVLTLAVAWVHNGALAVVDEGVYATQAQSLAAGSWTSPRPAPDLDPDGSAKPLLDSRVIGDDIIAYDRHALYPLVIAPAFKAFGFGGALAVSTAGVWLAALASAFIARRLDDRFAVPALWLAGVGSPLFFDGMIVWAHSLAAAAIGFAFLGVTRSFAGRRRGLHLTGGLVAGALAVLLRSEGVIVIASLGAAVGVSAIDVRKVHRGDGRWIDPQRAVTGLVVGVVAVGSYWIDTQISRSVGGGGGYGMAVQRLVLSDSTGPWPAIRSSLLGPGALVGSRTTVLVVSSMVLLLLGALTARLRVRFTSVPWVLGMLAAVGWIAAVVIRLQGGSSAISGLFPAFPLFAAAAVLCRGDDLRSIDAKLAVGMAVISSGVLIVTVYDVGGGTEWGGRFFHVLLVPLIPLIVTVLVRTAGTYAGSERRALWFPVLALALAPSVIALQWVHVSKGYSRGEITTVRRMAERVTTPGERPLALVWNVSRSGTSRLFWQLNDRIDVLAPPIFRRMFVMLELPQVRARGAVVIVTDVPPSIFQLLIDEAVGDTSWSVDEADSWTDGVLQMLVLRPTAT